MRVLRESHADDMAATEKLLREAGDEPVARVYVPRPTVAFGRLDTHSPGFQEARAAAQAHGFAPVVRLAGGHAAAYDGGSVVVDVVEPTGTVFEGIEERFERLTAILADVLGAEVGELPGEYCAGRFSLHVGGTKVAGLGQRSVRGASLTSAMVVVTGGARIHAVLVDVYAALGIDWDPSTAGALEDHRPGASVEEIASALARRLGWRG